MKTGQEQDLGKTYPDMSTFFPSFDNKIIGLGIWKQFLLSKYFDFWSFGPKHE